MDGEHASITLYAKYGAAGLYTDRARTTAAALVPQSATGYTLSAKHLTSGEITFTDFAEIAALTPTENEIYTLNTELAKYNVSQMENNNAVATITFTSGVTEGKAVYGTPVSFSVTPAESQIVKSVTYNVSNGADVTEYPENGSYSIPGAQITGDITIRAVTDEYVTIIFRSGAGASIGGEVTAYAIKGLMALYSGHNDAALDGSFTVPTVTPAERYRVDNDTAEDAWYYGAIDYCAGKGYFSGIGNGAFAPEGTMQRGMLAAVARRIADGEYSGVELSFSNV